MTRQIIMSIVEALYFLKSILHGKKNQREQINEIRESGRSLYLAADGQCDSPGHNATYNTMTMLDTKTNKILDFSIVHVKVCPYIVCFVR